jgi:hypothetical protein
MQANFGEQIRHESKSVALRILLTSDGTAPSGAQTSLE